MWYFIYSKNHIINYKDTNFSEKVCKIINGYYHIINKFIWMKNKNIIIFYF